MYKEKGSKIVNIEEFIVLRKKFREEAKKVIHCHGVYDLIHPGHIIHLKEAKSIGDILVVSITAGNYVQKGPGRPYFSDELRMETLAALECVDYVILSEYITSIEMIDSIQPDFYVKGAEYEEFEKDITQNITPEVECVRRNGGAVYFTRGETFSSTKLLNNNFAAIPEEVKEITKQISEKYSFNDIHQLINEMKNTKVLVIGDIIIDEYVFCNVQGLMSKDRAFSARYEKEERYLGGSLAVARHIANFSDNVTVCGIVGDEAEIHSQILNDLSKSMFIDLQFDNKFRTVIKKRYLERRGIRNEYNKLFSINYINEKEQFKVDRENFYEKLENSISNFDLVVVTDYGHGLIDERIMEIVQQKAKFLSINCQTNSTNYGMNLITKYYRADTFTLDERELRLAYSNNIEKLEVLLNKLQNHLKSNVGWVTTGSHGAVGINEQYEKIKCPAMTLSVQDTVGAGDAFFALTSLCAHANVPIEIATFLGNIAGALAANILGNSHAIGKVKLLKFASTLLNV